jgi:hypothetical protein
LFNTMKKRFGPRTTFSISDRARAGAVNRSGNDRVLRAKIRRPQITFRPGADRHPRRITPRPARRGCLDNQTTEQLKGVTASFPIGCFSPAWGVGQRQINFGG